MYKIARRGPLAGIILVVMLMACSHSVWDDIPDKITTFISTYYPGVGISRYADDGGTYYVTIKNGPSMTFNSNYQWTMIDGNGVALPSIFIYNEMPEVYEYLLAREETSGLMKAVNNPRDILLTFSDFMLQYIKETGEVLPYIPKS